MSLDVYLTLEGKASESGSGIFVRENGQVKEISRAEWDEKFPRFEPVTATFDDDDEDNTVYTANITHNLNRMAAEAGIYEALWRPDEKGIEHAHQLIEPLTKGLEKLKGDPAHYKQFNASNGWGLYKHFVPWVERYLEACKQYPSATVSAWR